MSGEKDKAYDEGIEALKLAVGVLSMPVEPTKEQRAEIKRILTRAAERLADTRGLGLIKVEKRGAETKSVGDEWTPTLDTPCPKCDKNVYYRVIGDHEDHNYYCPACGHSWWVDGPDF